jgi:hypothetical protein
MSSCSFCKKLICEYYNYRCQVCIGLACSTCLRDKFYNTQYCCKRLLVCINCHGPKKLCSCCVNVCRLQIYNCTYCNTKSHIVDRKPLYCKGCKAIQTRQVCCECSRSVPEIKAEIVDIKNTINHILCDPSKIVLEYWNDRYMNDCLVDVNKFELHDTVECVKCSYTFCEFHGICESKDDGIYCGVCLTGTLGEINM